MFWVPTAVTPTMGVFCVAPDDANPKAGEGHSHTLNKPDWNPHKEIIEALTPQSLCFSLQKFISSALCSQASEMPHSLPFPSEIPVLLMYFLTFWSNFW